MLSNGGKKSFCCPNCESADIIDTKKGLVITAAVPFGTHWSSIPRRSWLCLDCFKFGTWSSRLKLPALPDDLFSGKVSENVVELLKENIDDIEQYEFPVVKVDHKVPYMTDNSDYRRAPPPPPPRRNGSITEAGVLWSPIGVKTKDHWTHRPDDFGLWVGYNSWRFKDLYNVMLKDGEIVKCCYPNASSFSPMVSDTGYHTLSEYDIIAVQLCTYEDIKDTYWVGADTEEGSNDYRALKNADTFGGPDYDTADKWSHVVPQLFDLETKKVLPEYQVKPQRQLRGYTQSLLMFDDAGYTKHFGGKLCSA